MRLDELAPALATNGPAPLYLIYGRDTKFAFDADECLQEEAVGLIKRAVLGEDGDATDGMASFNAHTLYGDEADAAEILSAAQEAPAFAARRFLLVKAADKLSAKDGEALMDYLKVPCETTTLVFVTAKKLDGRRKFTQAIKDRAVVVDCGPPLDGQLAAWIRKEAAAQGLQLSDAALGLLKELAASLKDLPGASLHLIRHELEKLAAHLPPGSTAGADDVEALRGMEAGASVFDLAAALGARDRAKALRILARNLDTGEDPLRILGALAYQYRMIWKAKEDPRQWGRWADLSRAFTDARLRAAFERFAETDSKLKGAAGGSKERVLEALLLDLGAGAPKTR